MNSGVRLSIRFVTRKWPPAVGGMETFSACLVRSLRAFAQVDVIALPGREGGAPPTAMALLRFGFATSVRLLLAEPRDVTHVGDMASWPLALIARFRSRRTRIALSANGSDVSFPFRDGVLPQLYGLYLKVAARLLPSAIVIANSTATAEAAERYGFKHTAVVPLATDVRASTSIGPQGTKLLFVGRITARKGCGWFIQNVLTHLPEEITLRVAGTVWDEDERAALDNSRVTFLGPVYGDVLIREYSSALCVVIPTRDFEGFGLTAVEAAACGGVVLASCHSGLKEAVIDGVTGFHLPSGDPEAWAQKIRDIARWQPDQRKAFVANAMATTIRHYSWERVARETIQAYSRHTLDFPIVGAAGATN